ncbi:hypothetical protein ACJX0J_038954 [Zea mays]
MLEDEGGGGPTLWMGTRWHYTSFQSDASNKKDTIFVSRKINLFKTPLSFLMFLEIIGFLIIDWDIRPCASWLSGVQDLYISFSHDTTGFFLLGGHAIYLGPDDIQMGKFLLCGLFTNITNNSLWEYIIMKQQLQFGIYLTEIIMFFIIYRCHFFWVVTNCLLRLRCRFMGQKEEIDYRNQKFCAIELQLEKLSETVQATLTLGEHTTFAHLLCIWRGQSTTAIKTSDPCFHVDHLAVGNRPPAKMMRGYACTSFILSCYVVLLDKLLEHNLEYTTRIFTTREIYKNDDKLGIHKRMQAQINEHRPDKTSQLSHYFINLLLDNYFINLLLTISCCIVLLYIS